MFANFNSKSVLHLTKIFSSLHPCFSTANNTQNKIKSPIKKESKFAEKKPSIINSEEKEIQQFVRRDNKINIRDKKCEETSHFYKMKQLKNFDDSHLHKTVFVTTISIYGLWSLDFFMEEEPVIDVGVELCQLNMFDK
uniref:Uncharacterized protein n=1 Tax=Meloidogyne hapla TaxID=6305 RepID=A0A1I8BRW9_MELHA